MAYTDMVQLVRDIREHTRETGHRVESKDLPKLRMLWYECDGCFNEDGVDKFWAIGLKAVKTLRYRRDPEALLFRELVGTSAGRLKLIEYLNYRIDLDLAPILDRYHRPWPL